MTVTHQSTLDRPDAEYVDSRPRWLAAGILASVLAVLVAVFLAPALVKQSPSSARASSAPAALPALFPAVDESLHVGEPLDLGGDLAVLEGKRGDGDVEAGDVRLALSASGTTYRIDLPAGGHPSLLANPVGDHAVLVLQETGDATLMRVYAVRAGALAEVASDPDVPFGNGFVVTDGAYAPHRTWLADDGVLWTAVQLDESARHRLWSWTVGDMMTAEDRGEACIDWTTNTAASC